MSLELADGVRVEFDGDTPLVGRHLRGDELNEIVARAAHLLGLDHQRGALVLDDAVLHGEELIRGGALILRQGDEHDAGSLLEVAVDAIV